MSLDPKYSKFNEKKIVQQKFQWIVVKESLSDTCNKI